MIYGVSCGKIRKTDELLKGYIHSYHISFKGFVVFVIKCAKQRNNIKYTFNNRLISKNHVPLFITNSTLKL